MNAPTTNPPSDQLVVRDGRLVCPLCRSSYLHHGTVRVFDRREDAPLVRLTEADAGGVSVREVKEAGSGNPSMRRDGLTVQFWCEECDGSARLEIAQHKGETEVGWAGVVGCRRR